MHFIWLALIRDLMLFCNFKMQEDSMLTRLIQRKTSFTFLMNSKHECSLRYSATRLYYSFNTAIFSPKVLLFYFSLCFFVKLISLPLSLFLILSSRNNTHGQWSGNSCVCESVPTSQNIILFNIRIKTNRSWAHFSPIAGMAESSFHPVNTQCARPGAGDVEEHSAAFRWCYQEEFRVWLFPHVSLAHGSENTLLSKALCLPLPSRLAFSLSIALLFGSLLSKLPLRSSSHSSKKPGKMGDGKLAVTKTGRSPS